MSQKYKPGDYVEIVNETSYGFVRRSIGQANSEWLYEVDDAFKNGLSYISAESDLMPAQSPYSKTQFSMNINMGGSNTLPSSQVTWPCPMEDSDLNTMENRPTTLAPSCECGLHAVDPKRTFGHSTWCPLYSNLT